MKKSYNFFVNTKAILIGFLLSIATAASAQTTLNIDQVLSDPSKTTGSLFIDTVRYAFSSFTVPSATNATATIALPAQMVPYSVSPFSNSVQYDESQVSGVTYNASSNQIIIVFKNPLPAGSTGELQIKMKYITGTTPNSYAPNLIASIAAANVANSLGILGDPNFDTTSITAIASNTVTVSKNKKAGGAINDVTIYQLNIAATAGAGSLQLTNPVLIDTLPVDAVFQSATTFSGSNTPVYNPSDRTITWTWPSGTTFTSYSSACYVTVKYPNTSFATGDNVCNRIRLFGDVPSLPIGAFESTSSADSYCFTIANPTAKANCTGGNITAATASWIGDHILAGTTCNTFSNGWKNNGNTELDEVNLTYTVDKSIDMNTIKIRPIKDVFDSVRQATIFVEYATNLNPSFTTLGTFYSLDIASNSALESQTPSLATGEYITQVHVRVTGTLPLGAKQDLSYCGNARRASQGAKDGSAIVEGEYGAPITGTLITNNSTGNFVYNGTTTAYSSCNGASELIAPQPAFKDTKKAILNSSSNFKASDTVNYKFSTFLGGNLSATNVVVSDTLDARLMYVPGSSEFKAGSSALAPITPVVSTTAGGQTILTYNLGTLTVNKTYIINFDAVIKPGTAAGTIPNQMTLNSDNALFNNKTNIQEVTIISAVALRAFKGQSGCDPGFVYYPVNAVAQEGGPVNYKITVKNLGNVVAKDLVLVDVFPYISDYRGSEWYANLAGPVTTTDASSTVYYTTVSNPCYSDFTSATNPAGCNTPSWSTTPPVDITKVKAIKIVRAANIPILDSIDIVWPMRAPVGVPQGLLMNNSIIYQVSRADNGSRLLPAIPNLVGMYTNCTPVLGSIGNYAWIDSNKNGLNDEAAAAGLNGVKVYLYNLGADNAIGGGDDVLVDSTITANDFSGKKGYYKFVEVPSGKYYVHFATDYDQYIITPSVNQTPKTDNNSDANPTSGNSGIITINAAGTGQDKDNTTIDAGFYPTGTLGNYVWNDVNGDGINNEAASKGINGVTVNLLKDDGTGNYTWYKNTVTANDASGNPGYYNFIITESGNYKVLFPTNVSGKSLTAQTTTAGVDNNSDANVATGYTNVIVMNVFGTGKAKNNPTIDAGYLLCDNATIAYTANPYCPTGTASVTLTGATGGIFSSTNPAVVVNPTTGEVDLEASTVNNSYPITYSYGVGGCATQTTGWIALYNCYVSSGGTGGVESKSLGDIITRREIANAKSGKYGPVDYVTLPVAASKVEKMSTFGSKQNGTLGALNTSLTALMPAVIGFEGRYTSPTDLTNFTNANEVVAIDYLRNQQPKAVAFATKTTGEVYNHTKPICDRLKGAELKNIDKITVSGINLVRYQLKNSDGNTEYATSFSVGVQNGRNNFSIQSNWLTQDYNSDEIMYNFQLWAVSPELVETLATDLLAKLTTIAPVQISNEKQLPATYIASGKRVVDNLELTVNNNSTATTGYFAIKERANEQAQITSRIVPFAIAPNTVSKVTIAVNDTYESDITMFINNQVQDLVYMSDGAWAVDYNKATTNVSSFTVNNDVARVYNSNEWPLLRNVQVKAITPDYVTVSKVLKGGAVGVDVSAYKSLKFTAQGGNSLRITLVKKSIANWDDQYSLVVPLAIEEKDYYVSLSDFVSKTKKVFNANDISTIVMSIEVGTGKTTSIANSFKSISFSKEDAVYVNSLSSKEVQVYPNPATSSFTCSFRSDKNASLTVKLTELTTGKVIYTKAVQATRGLNKVLVDLNTNGSNLGAYLLTVNGADAVYQRKNILLKR